ncbi:MAG: hypothetical protein M3R63_18500 [Actinomycetota bacterium]|nr:hypothetical protein [Actinomycetota bacterium]
MAAGPGFAPIHHDQVADIALAQRGLGTYKLGGGAIYTAPDAFDDAHNQFPGFCDCSGLLAFTGYRRGPWNTDAIVRDATSLRKRFRLVAPGEAVRRGDFLVKAGPDKDGDGRRDYPGHCGVITGVLPEFVRGSKDWYEDLEVTHCSGALQNRIDPATGKRYGAVRTTNAAIWKLAGYIIRPLWVS